ncbi:DUF748 domain-containing protein [Pseudoxanthomonas putridarboris]|uniref:DUF748 domain-containing protein n=1 Tax=Pseudoxanthomonas putridarboris TaxID=752605 RepID=A0ABU9J5J8_9GAMM
MHWPASGCCPASRARKATAYVSEELGKSLSLGELRFNPFTFRAEAHDIAIRERGPATGKPLVALRRLALDFQLSSLWKGAYTFGEVALEGPYANAIVRPDGSLNLVELVPGERDDSPTPSVFVGHLAVTGGAIDFADHSRRLQPSKRLAPIHFELRDFHTMAGQGGDFRLAAAGDQGERFDWHGRVSLQPFASQGDFTVAKLQARTAYEFLSEQLPMELAAGELDVAGHYDFSAGGADGLRLDAALSQAKASGLTLRAKGDAEDAVVLPGAELAGTRFSWQKREILIDALRLDGLETALRMEADGSFNLQRLLPPVDTAVAPTDKPWLFQLGRLSVENADVQFEDRMVRPASRFHLQPLSLAAERVSLDLAQAVPIHLSATVNGKARLALQGEVVLADNAGKLQLDLSGLPLRDVLAYLPDFPRLELRSGDVAAKGELELPSGIGKGPQLAFRGEATIDRFSLVERASRREVVAWDRVDARGVHYTQAPEAVRIAQVRARKAFAIVVVEPDSTLNLANLFAGQASASPQTGPPMAIRIDDLQLDDATMAFADQSIDPNFSARVEALRGHLRGLSTAADAVARVELDGQVINRYSPVRIEGGINPFAYDRQTDLKMSFRNIDLPIFNPYSGRFAGYAIAKGKLTTELHYRIDHRQLEAAHHVILDQLEWGQETDSKEKVSLPIRLATSLLKNRDGVIDLDLPVTGSLDDPSFRVWPVVWQILKNILVRIVTAPFDFIGSLFKGAEQAQYVDFAPGSATIPDGARQNLATLAKGLAERPAIRLDIPSGPALDVDAGAMADARLAEALLGLRKGEPVAWDSLDIDDQIDLLEKLYRQQLGHRPDLPRPEVAEEASRQERKAERKQGERDGLRQALLPRYQPGPAELEELGRQRANAIQDALLAEDSLDPARVFISAAKGPAPHEGGVRVELALE